MKKYFLLTAVFAVIFLTACGTNDITADTSVQTSETTLNSVTEMTVPAFEPEWNETEVTSPAYDPSADEDTSSETVPVITVPAYDPDSDGDTASETVTETTVSVSEPTVYEYSAKIFSVSEEYVTVMMLDNTFFCKMGEHVRLVGHYDVSEEELITFVISDDVDVDNPASANFVWQIDEEDFVLKTSASDMTVEAEVTEFYESSDGGHFMVVEAYGLAGYYDAVPISLVTDEKFEVGDRIIVEFSPETIFMETSPLQVNSEYVLSIIKN